MPNLTEGTRRHERQGPYGHPPPTASSSENRQLYRAGRPADTSGSSNIYSQSGGQSHSGGGYAAANPQHQDWNVPGHDEHDYRDKVPPGGSPVASYSSK